MFPSTPSDVIPSSSVLNPCHLIRSSLAIIITSTFLGESSLSFFWPCLLNIYRCPSKPILIMHPMSLNSVASQSSKTLHFYLSYSAAWPHLGSTLENEAILSNPFLLFPLIHMEFIPLYVFYPHPNLYSLYPFCFPTPLASFWCHFAFRTYGQSSIPHPLTLLCGCGSLTHFFFLYNSSTCLNSSKFLLEKCNVGIWTFYNGIFFSVRVFQFSN